MAATVPARLTAAEGRRFALTLAAGFATLAAIAWWRERAVMLATCGALATIALVAALVVPSRLGPVQRAWMALGVQLSRITTPVFFGAIYLLVLTPTGLLRRWLRRSPLARDPSAPSYWVARVPADPDARRRALEHLF